jgi:exopolysaccharide biosynthesis protein
MSVKPVRALAACLVALVSLAAGQSTHGAEASTRYRTRTVRITKGLTLSRILDRWGPNRIRVLKVDPRTSLTIDVALSNNQLPGRERTSAMARRHRAIAATNGTYGLPWGRPIGLFSEDGKLHTSPLMGKRAFSISRDESAAHFGSPHLLMRARVLDTGSKWSIHAWNKEGRPGRREIAALTPAGAGYLKPPRWACSARLYPIGPRTWTKDGNGLTTDHVVDAVRCREERMRARGGTVVSALWRGEADDDIRALERDQIVRLSWSLRWAGVMDMIAGNPTLLEGGIITATNCPTSFCNRNPRTGVGVTPEGKLLLVTVDGRHRRRSVGMTPIQFAKLFRRLGARWALNLDGGGSTTMFVRDRLVNRPSDPDGERAVSSALLVLPGPDHREAEPRLYSGPAPVVGNVIGVSPRLEIATPTDPDPAATDPASSGGMLEALSSGGLGGEPQALPRALERIVDHFQARRHRL